MLDSNGNIRTLCKCCVVDEPKQTKHYNVTRVHNYDIKSDTELTSPDLILIGKGRRTNLIGSELADARLINENPNGYFYRYKGK